MNGTLMVSFLRQRLTSPVRLLVLAFLLFMPLLLVAVSRGTAGFVPLGDMMSIVMVFAVGMIGHDVSSGVLQLLFTRPIRRWEYVISRWLTVALAAAAVGVSQAVLAWGVMSLGDAAPEVGRLVFFAAERVVEAFGIAAVMTLLSSLVAGYADLALFAALSIGGGILGMSGQAMRQPALSAVGSEISAFLAPKIALVQLFSGHPSWPVVAAYGSTVTLCLLLAVVLVNRKELSYASG